MKQLPVIPHGLLEVLLGTVTNGTSISSKPDKMQKNRPPSEEIVDKAIESTRRSAMDKYTQGRLSSQVSRVQKCPQQMVEAQNLCLTELKAYGSAIRGCP